MIFRMGAIVPILLLLAPPAAAAPAATGRHWQLSITGTECAPAQVSLSARIRYLGPQGPVEAPVSALLDATGAAHPPKSLVWRGGSKALTQWLAAGGIHNVQSEHVADVQLKFDTGPAAGELRLAFGDIAAFPVAREGTCLAPGDIPSPRARRARAADLRFRIYRAAYPCQPRQGAPRVIEANHPPHLPRQLLVLGRGYLPNAREVELPMGKAPAQSYAYAGPDELDAIDAVVRRAVAADFPRDGAGLAERRYFAFNWGVQRTASGNDAYSIGIYDLRPCAP
jgi:hypothetical protein